MIDHKEREHSKFSASGSERWLNCAASVEIEEQSPPSKDSHWSVEGTIAHEVLESLMTGKDMPHHFQINEDMLWHVGRVVAKVRALHKLYGGFLGVEKRVYAQFVHPEMFGTLDIFIAPTVPLNNVRTLHILDFKYGQGHVVTAEKNTQLIQYALSVAESYGWELAFDEAKLWVLQPRAGDNWHKSWIVPMKTLREIYLPVWNEGVARVEKGGHKPFPGSWCHWCRGNQPNPTCPAKKKIRMAKTEELFSSPIERN